MKGIYSKLKKAPEPEASLIEQLPETATSTQVEDKLREVIDFINKQK